MNPKLTYCHIREGEVFINGELFYQHMGDEPFLVGLYRHLGLSYPKFFKMDEMSRMAFLGSEMVLVRSELERFTDDEVALLFANRSSSLMTDGQFRSTLEGGIPSPALFVYTLPNIGMGEVCIRHRFYGENSFLVMEDFSPEQLLQTALPLLQQGAAKAVLLGWVETDGEHHDGFFVFLNSDSEITSDELKKRYEMR
ncbi:MAG: 3-oxoacyl-ACP synthase [Flavobacteriales bacterium]|nr:3-oxoacyl-ACP synthase [Flavobacteriales bacterium]